MSDIPQMLPPGPENFLNHLKVDVDGEIASKFPVNCYSAGQFLFLGGTYPLPHEAQKNLNTPLDGRFNFEAAELSEGDELALLRLPPEHPLRQAATGVVATMASALIALYRANGNSFEGIHACAQVTLSVAATPNFHRVGALGTLVARRFRHMFRQDQQPAMTSHAVAGLPGGHLFELSGIFLRSDAEAPLDTGV